jgi:hypothetical protein
MKKWFLTYEQVILFYTVIIYLISFMFIFDEQMRTTEWMGLVWIVQFFGLGTWLGLRGRKKGWIWPSRP